MSVKKIPCECYSRIVGYFRPIRNWNKGARQMHQDRLMYNQPGKEQLDEASLQALGHD